jgi:iron(III) transport system permease protein
MLDVGTPVRVAIDFVFGTSANHPLYGGGGVSFVMGLEHAPLMFLSIAAACRAVPCDLVEAARAAGASHRRLLFTIILPLLKPALLAGGAWPSSRRSAISACRRCSAFPAASAC